MQVIPYGRQLISQADIDAVNEVLRSDWLTQGPAVDRFERAAAEFCGARHAVAVSNATAALHIAARALGLGPGDWLWTSPNTFVATANCALYCGANVDFVDIDPATYNLCPQALEAKLKLAKAANRLPKVVAPVHFSGQPCAMEAIAALGKEYGFRIIEDASHAVGGRYGKERIGSCQYSDITVFSFHPVKIVTTGEGGLALTNDSALHRELSLLRTHGITRDESLMESPSEGPWYYQQIGLGYNYRITDFQCALGLSQWQRIDEFIRRRVEIAKRYDAAFAGLPLRTPAQKHGESAWHLYVIWVDPGPDGTRRRQVIERLRSDGILVNVHYIPVHLQPYYRRLGFKPGDFPEAERYYAGAITLPMYPALSADEQTYVIDKVKAALQ